MLMNLEGVSSGHNLKAIRELHNHGESHVRSLKSFGVPSSSFGAMLASVIMNKLLHDLRLAVSKEITDAEWNLEQVMTIVERELDTRERAAANTKPVQRGAGRGHPPTASTLLSSSFPSCSFYGQSHFSINCEIVSNVGERKQSLRKSGRCFVCLRKGHLGKDYSSKIIQELSQLQRKTPCKYLFQGQAPYTRTPKFDRESPVGSEHLKWINIKHWWKSSNIPFHYL